MRRHTIQHNLLVLRVTMKTILRIVYFVGLDKHNMSFTAVITLSTHKQWGFFVYVSSGARGPDLLPL